MLYDDINIIILNFLNKNDLYKLNQVNNYYNNLIINNVYNITQIIKNNNRILFYKAETIRIIETIDNNLLINILNKFKNYKTISFENIEINNQEDNEFYYNFFIKVNNLKIKNSSLISNFKYDNYISLVSLTLENNNLKDINNDIILDNIILLTKLKELYIENIFNKNETLNINKLTILTHLDILGLSKINNYINYSFLKNMTKIKKLYLNNNYKNMHNIYAPLCLEELYIKGLYNNEYYISYINNNIINCTFLNLKIIDISDSPYIFIEQIINIIKLYYRSLNKIFINNCNLGDLKISKLANYIKQVIPELNLDLYLKYNRFNYDSLITLNKSAKNIKIYVSKHDMCVCDEFNYFNKNIFLK